MKHLHKELERTIMYAKSLGIVVNLIKAKRSDPDAEWTTDGSEITLYLRHKKSITRLILDLVHELAHHMAFVYNNRKVPRKINKVFAKYSETEIKLTKKERKIIYEEELFDSQYQETIFKELNLKLPLYKLQVERDLSNWIYFTYYKTGKYPIIKDVQLKRNELTLKYKKE
jgi:hypothetical protein